MNKFEYLIKPLLIAGLAFATILAVFKLVGPIPVSVTQTTIAKNEPFMVNGEGTVAMTPDIAEISLGITTNKPTVSAAQEETNRVINSLTDAMKQLGVGDEDIKTTNYSVNPNYDWNSGTQRITGYNVNANLLVKFKNFDNLNQALDQATSLGANQVGGINFTLSDDKQHQAEDEARKEAVAQAKTKAESLSQAAGIKLGKLINVTENTFSPPTPMYARAEAMDAKAVSGPTPTEIQPGSQEVKLMVTLSYETL